MQIAVPYGLRCNPSEAYLITEGALRYPSRPQICLIMKKEIAPNFLNHYCVIDALANEKRQNLTGFGDEVLGTGQILTHNYVARIETQIEFTCTTEVIESIHDIIMPALHFRESIEILSDEVTGFLVVLRVYKINREIESILFKKGRQGSSTIFRLYSNTGLATVSRVSLIEPVIPNGVFEQLREEIVQAIRIKGALVGVYNNDKKGIKQLQDIGDARRALQPKRDYDLDADEDYAQTDYDTLYETILENYPNLKEVVSYISNVRPAQKGEIRDLVMRSKLGDNEADSRLLDVHLRSILRQALYFHRRYNKEIDDLFQEGVYGFQIGLPKYNINGGSAFGTYINLWVRQNILRRIVYSFDSMYVPVHQMEKILRAQPLVLNHFCNECRFDSCVALNSEIASELECSEEEAKNIIRLCLPMISYEDLHICRDSGEVSYEYYLDADLRRKRLFAENNEINEMLEDIYQDYIAETINTELSKLSIREAYVLRERYGIDGPSKTLEEIGQELGVTRERVRQIQKKAENRWKKHARKNSERKST